MRCWFSANFTIFDMPLTKAIDVESNEIFSVSSANILARKCHFFALNYIFIDYAWRNWLIIFISDIEHIFIIFYRTTNVSWTGRITLLFWHNNNPFLDMYRFFLSCLDLYRGFCKHQFTIAVEALREKRCELIAHSVITMRDNKRSTL